MAKLTGESDIKDYTTYLVENAGAAIMAWLINGAVKAIKNGFRLPMPEAVRKACEEYRENNNWIRDFIEECCQSGKGFFCRSGQLFEAYQNYCKKTGEYCHKSSDFTQELERLGYQRRVTNKGKFFYGIGLIGYDFSD